MTRHFAFETGGAMGWEALPGHGTWNPGEGVLKLTVPTPAGDAWSARLSRVVDWDVGTHPTFWAAVTSTGDLDPNQRVVLEAVRLDGSTAQHQLEWVPEPADASGRWVTRPTELGADLESVDLVVNGGPLETGSFALDDVAFLGGRLPVWVHHTWVEFGALDVLVGVLQDPDGDPIVVTPSGLGDNALLIGQWAGPTEDTVRVVVAVAPRLGQLATDAGDLVPWVMASR